MRTTAGNVFCPWRCHPLPPILPPLALPAPDASSARSQPRPGLLRPVANLKRAAKLRLFAIANGLDWIHLDASRPRPCCNVCALGLTIRLAFSARRLMHYAPVSDEILVVTLVYVDKLISRAGGQLRLSSLSVHRLLLSCLLVAIKFYSDAFYSNAYLANVGGVPTRELNALERLILRALTFDLLVSSEHFRYMYVCIVNRVPLRMPLKYPARTSYGWSLEQVEAHLAKQSASDTRVRSPRVIATASASQQSHLQVSITTNSTTSVNMQHHSTQAQQDASTPTSSLPSTAAPPTAPHLAQHHLTQSVSGSHIPLSVATPSSLSSFALGQDRRSASYVASRPSESPKPIFGRLGAGLWGNHAEMLPPSTTINKKKTSSPSQSSSQALQHGSTSPSSSSHGQSHHQKHAQQHQPQHHMAQPQTNHPQHPFNQHHHYQHQHRDQHHNAQHPYDRSAGGLRSSQQRQPLPHGEYISTIYSPSDLDALPASPPFGASFPDDVTAMAFGSPQRGYDHPSFASPGTPYFAHSGFRDAVVSPSYYHPYGSGAPSSSSAAGGSGSYMQSMSSPNFASRVDAASSAGGTTTSSTSGSTSGSTTAALTISSSGDNAGGGNGVASGEYVASSSSEMPFGSPGPYGPGALSYLGTGSSGSSYASSSSTADNVYRSYSHPNLRFKSAGQMVASTLPTVQSPTLTLSGQQLRPNSEDDDVGSEDDEVHDLVHHLNNPTELRNRFNYALEYAESSQTDEVSESAYSDVPELDELAIKRRVPQRFERDERTGSLAEGRIERSRVGNIASGAPYYGRSASSGRPDARAVEDPSHDYIQGRGMDFVPAGYYDDHNNSIGSPGFPNRPLAPFSGNKTAFPSSSKSATQPLSPTVASPASSRSYHSIESLSSSGSSETSTTSSTDSCASESTGKRSQSTPSSSSSFSRRHRQIIIPATAAMEGDSIASDSTDADLSSTSLRPSSPPPANNHQTGSLKKLSKRSHTPVVGTTQEYGATAAPHAVRAASAPRPTSTSWNQRQPQYRGNLKRQGEEPTGQRRSGSIQTAQTTQTQHSPSTPSRQIATPSRRSNSRESTPPHAHSAHVTPSSEDTVPMPTQRQLEGGDSVSRRPKEDGTDFRPSLSPSATEALLGNNTNNTHATAAATTAFDLDRSFAVESLLIHEEASQSSPDEGALLK